MHLRTALSLWSLVLCVVVAPTSAFGPEWEEDDAGDAGRTPGTAQPVSMPGGGPLGGISGRLAGTSAAAGEGDFQDMYVINIIDPAGFTATTVNSDAHNGFTEFDSQLYLFHIDGLGLLANDNVSVKDSASFLGPEANDGSGAQITQPGLYLIAISGFDSDPISDDGLIFDMPAGSTEISGPDGPGGGLPVIDWNQPGETGEYRIEFTGAAFIDIPAKPCPTDLDGNDFTDIGDLLSLLSNWGADGTGAALAEPFDIVDIADLLVLLAAWGECPVQSGCGNPDAGDCCQANGTPFCENAACCTAVCFVDPFCCEVQWDADCADAAADSPACPCSGDMICRLPCPPDATDEGEACGDNTNGGCIDKPKPPNAITCGQAICGTAWAEDGVRDTDWFVFTIEEETQVTATLESQFPGVVFIAECHPPIVRANGASDECAAIAPASTCLQAGTYAVFVATGNADGSPIFDGYPCSSGMNEYVVALQCTPAVCPQCGDADTGDCCSANGSPYCNQAECCASVCADDPFCCDTEWDSICAEAALRDPACDCS